MNLENAKMNIDKDDVFYLHRLNGLDLLLKTGLTVDPSETFPGASDMTLIQYAIAMRKPKTLKDMLDTLLHTCQEEFVDILYPMSSNTKGNLISLAVEYGSKKDKVYNDTDVSCLKVLINFSQQKGNGYRVFNYEKKYDKEEEFSVDIIDVNGETPLVSAIRSDNADACKVLIENGADLLIDLSHVNQFIGNPFKFALKNARDKDILSRIFDFLDENKKLDFLDKMKSDEYYNCMSNIAKDFYKERTGNDIDIIRDFKESAEPAESPESAESPQALVDNSKCFACHCTNDMTECEKCHHSFCDECFHNPKKHHCMK